MLLTCYPAEGCSNSNLERMPISGNQGGWTLKPPFFSHVPFIAGLGAACAFLHTGYAGALSDQGYISFRALLCTYFQGLPIEQTPIWQSPRMILINE